MAKYKKDDSDDGSVDTSKFESGLSEEEKEPQGKNQYKQETSEEAYDVLFEQHFEDVIDQAEEKTQGYNRQDRVEQLQEEAENEGGWKEYFFKAKASYHQAIFSFARSDGYMNIGGFSLGWMMPQFLAVGWILTWILASTVSEAFVFLTLATWVAIPVSIYFIFDVFDYFGNEQVTRKPTKIMYALFGLVPILGVVPFHFRYGKHQEKSIDLFINKNQRVIDNLAEKYQ